MSKVKKDCDLLWTLTADGTDTNSEGQDGEPFDKAIIYYDITAVTGTSPTLILGLQVSPDDGTTWFSRASHPTISGVTRDRFEVSGIGLLFRVTRTYGGTTPAFTGKVWLEREKTGIE